MLYGLYLSAQGANAQATRLEVTANNLANAQTSGFKRDLARFQAHRPFDAEQGFPGRTPSRVAQATGGLSLYDVATNFEQGPLLQTDQPLDLALTGPGFLQVSDGRQEYLTRNGRLTLGTNGQLVTSDGGLTVLSTDGQPIALPPEGVRVEIAADGTLTSVNPEGNRTVLGRLAIVRPASLDPLEKVGRNLYRTAGDVAAVDAGAQLRQGYLESSATNPMTEMTQLIEASRSFEMNMNLLRSQDESLGQLLATMRQ